MQRWKFLLLGITGDLAKIKILPSISQFAENFQEEVQIDLIGYSRSVPNVSQIQKILNESSKTGKHSLNSLNFFQGEYDNLEFFDSLYSSASDDERLIIYMAVPPSVFLKFLKNSCPHNDKNINIIVEKPFGRNFNEALEILNTLKECHLLKRVHFLDHYLFKPQLQLSKLEMNNFKDIKNKKIVSIKIQALESVKVGSRGRYYDSVGALKDMLPHLFSILLQVLKNFTKDFSLETFKNFKISDLSLGQYEDYPVEVSNPESTTETYFKVISKLGETVIYLESGKSLKQKYTGVSIDFADGSSCKWQIAPDKLLDFRSAENSFTLSLDRGNKHDHTLMFEALLEKEFDFFVKPSEIITGWWLHDQIVSLRKFRNVSIMKYRNHSFESDLSTKIETSKFDKNQANFGELEIIEKQFIQSLEQLLTDYESLDSPSQSNPRKIQL